MAKTARPTREQLKPGECLCDHCTAKCCRYFCLPIDTPDTWDDFDSIRWYLAHGQTLVYVEKKTWYLLVSTRCQYLRPDNRCGIYLNRPKICGEYSTDECEYDTPWTFEKLFETPEQIWEYAEAVLPPRRRKRGAQAIVGGKRDALPPAASLVALQSNLKQIEDAGKLATRAAAPASP